MIMDNDDEVILKLKDFEETDIEFGSKAKKRLDDIINQNEKQLSDATRKHKATQTQPDLDLKPGVVYRIINGECQGQYAIYYRDLVLVFQTFSNN